MRVRDLNHGEEAILWRLYFDTIRTINIADYSEEQVKAWAPSRFDAAIWRDSIRATSPFVAEIEQNIVGYTDLQHDGLIDHFFVHHGYQRQGVGACLMQEIFRRADEMSLSDMYSNVSITAKPFFDRHGFTVEKEQSVEIRGVQLNNFLMRRLVPRR